MADDALAGMDQAVRQHVCVHWQVIDRRITVGADKGYDTEVFVQELRQLKVTPHVAQNNSIRKSAIDGRTGAYGAWVRL